MILPFRSIWVLVVSDRFTASIWKHPWKVTGWFATYRED
jgi:hypothetical protein